MTHLLRAMSSLQEVVCVVACTVTYRVRLEHLKSYIRTLTSGVCELVKLLLNVNV